MNSRKCTDTTLTQVPLDFVGSAYEEHSNIAAETDMRRLAQVSKTLTAPRTLWVRSLHRWHISFPRAYWFSLRESRVRLGAG